LEWFVADIFQEVDEELRRENYAKLWQRYGKYVIALAIGIVLVTAGVWRWQEYRLHLRQEEGARYASALDLARQGKDKEAADAFAEVAKQAGGGHRVLARLEEGALKARAGDNAGALAAYDALAADSGADPIYRDVARLLAAQCALKSGDAAAAVERVKPLTSASNPWHASALELTALADLKSGNKTEARVIYQRLADDLAAPQSLRARAAEMITALAE
jgi:hypothetical protein